MNTDEDPGEEEEEEELPARCQPKLSLCVAGLEESHREKRLMMKLIRSTSKWAASVITAKLPAK